MIHNLALQHFRCFPDLDLSLTPGINLIHGSNGSGKTSILEAIYLAGRARSFRTNYLSDLIHRNDNNAIIFIKGEQSDQHFHIGCQVTPSSLAVKLNNDKLKSRVSLLDFLPLQIITPVSHQLVDSGPSNRRKFIDWGLFHVEHSYRNIWSQFRRVLKQRNHVLKNKGTDLSSWNQQFTECADRLSYYHELYFEELSSYFVELQKQLLGNQIASIEFYAGWNKIKGLHDELKRSLHSDLARGFTQHGPHKADIKFSFVESKRNVLSRGQQKMLVFSLQLSQCLHLMNKTGLTPIVLIDDISSELDTNFLNRLVTTVKDLKLQSIISAIDEKSINSKLISNVFHVEHDQDN
ncbi:MAG: DNA replication/repair protein RecF [Gammaproteobacteria bacterium]|nr:DNA replication/repair protein RecF [Gammaproteobacteria bacterium]